jgi:hypothetical protein
VDEPSHSLAFTATTASGEVLEFQLPLHPQTSSREHVGILVEQILERVSDVVEGPDTMSDGDVLQALTLSLAVRLRVSGMSSETARDLVEDLANLALDAFEVAECVAHTTTHH